MVSNRRKLRAFLIVLTVLSLAGCADSRTEGSVTPESPYNMFLQKFQSENPDIHGVDMVSLADKYIRRLENDATRSDYITNVNYSVERCNFSQKDADYCDDLVITIDTQHNSDIYDKTLICIFVSEGGGNYKNVLLEGYWEQYLYPGKPVVEYELINVTGDGKSQIRLTMITGYTEYTTKRMQLLAYNEGRKEMSIIFNEIVYSDLFISYISSEEEKYRIRCDNEYQFVPIPSGGCDILLNTRIYERDHEERVLESGSTRFTYNGTQYVPDGAYYDYQVRAQRIQARGKS